MSIPVLFTIVFAMLSFGELLFGNEAEEETPKKSTEEQLGEAIAKLLSEKKETRESE